MSTLTFPSEVSSRLINLSDPVRLAFIESRSTVDRGITTLRNMLGSELREDDLVLIAAPSAYVEIDEELQKKREQGRELRRKIVDKVGKTAFFAILYVAAIVWAVNSAPPIVAPSMALAGLLGSILVFTFWIFFDLNDLSDLGKARIERAAVEKIREEASYVVAVLRDRLEFVDPATNQVRVVPLRKGDVVRDVDGKINVALADGSATVVLEHVQSIGPDGSPDGRDVFAELTKRTRS